MIHKTNISWPHMFTFFTDTEMKRLYQSKLSFRRGSRQLEFGTSVIIKPWLRPARNGTENRIFRTNPNNNLPIDGVHFTEILAYIIKRAGDMFITLLVSVFYINIDLYETGLVLINSIVSKHPGFSSERCTWNLAFCKCDVTLLNQVTTKNTNITHTNINTTLDEKYNTKYTVWMHVVLFEHFTLNNMGCQGPRVAVETVFWIGSLIWTVRKNRFVEM